jgi:hypothetical protein
MIPPVDRTEERIRVADWNNLAAGNVGGWITPAGRLRPIDTTLHIQDVCRNPEFFGLTLEGLLAIYDRHGEAFRPGPGVVYIGGEGRARDEVMIGLIEKGWVRYRRRNYRWMFDAWALTAKMKVRIAEWAKSQVTGGHGHEHVRIRFLRANRIMTYRMYDLAHNAHIDEAVDAEDSAE